MLDQAKMIKQAFDMKRKMGKIQKELKKKEIVINHGTVTVTITGEQRIKDVKIAGTEEDLRDIKKIERDVENAVNQAVADSQEMAQKAMQPMMGNMDLAGLMGGS